MTHPIFAFGDALADGYAALRPPDATFEGIPGFDHALDDLSPDGIDERKEAYRRWLSEVRQMPAAEGYWEQLAMDVITERLEVELLDTEYEVADLNNIASPPQDIAMVFEVMDQSDAAGWEQIVARLNAIPTGLAGYQASLELGRSQGKMAAVRQVAATLEQINEHRIGESGLATLEKHFDANGAPGGDTLRSSLQHAISAARDGLSDLGDYLESTYAPAAPEDDPVGPERYATATRYFLGDELDTEEVYSWGWEEIARLRKAMGAAAAQIAADKTIPEVIELLDADPERASRDREDFVEVMTEYQLQALRDLDGTAFRIPAQAKDITVNISPPGSTLGAQYIAPSEDWSRPGSVWYSLADDQHQIPWYSQISTNYHEGFPGHHLQIVYQAINAERMTRFHRKLVWYSGSGEGWALYSEKLMHELGYFDRPEFVLNTHAESMLRACRVVIDIGSHLGFAIPDGQSFHPGEAWTFEAAVEMLQEYALQPEAYARSEVTRYLGWPGQAIAYKVGEREILRMREELERRQGGDFDLIDFHDRVLTPGAIGLAHLRSLVLS